MIQSEVIIVPHNWPRYPIPPPCRLGKVVNDQRAADPTNTRKEENAHSSSCEDDILGTRSICLRQLRVFISQERQEVRNEHAELCLCFGRPLSFRKIENIADGPDRRV